jgi:hypothetical protein
VLDLRIDGRVLTFAIAVATAAGGLALLAIDSAIVRYSSERSRQIFDEALERLTAMPDVESAALVSPRLPFEINFSQTVVQVDSKTYDSDTGGEVIANVAVNARHSHRRRARVYRRRSQRHAARRRHQRDDGSQVLAGRQRGGAHVTAHLWLQAVSDRRRQR